MKLRRHPRTLVTLGALTILALALTVQIAGAVTWTNTVSGKVTDTTGNPIAGIWVQPYGLNESTNIWVEAGTGGYTGADGTYSITFTPSPTDPSKREATILFDERRQNIPAGKYFRDQWWQGKDASTQNLVPKATEAASATHFTITPSGIYTGYNASLKVYHVKLTGRIINRSGMPVANAWVRTYGRTLNTQTVAEGPGMITGPDGSYTIWVEPHVQDNTWWAIYASIRNSTAYDGRWYNNVLESHGMAMATQAAGSTVQHFTLDSDQQATGLDISLTQNKADTLLFSYARPKKKGSHTIVAGGYLNPVHDPTITIKAKIYKYNASKKKYVYKYTVTASQAPAGPSTKWWLSKKVPSHGKYKVKVYVGKHLWILHRATSASRTVTIK